MDNLSKDLENLVNFDLLSNDETSQLLLWEGGKSDYTEANDILDRFAGVCAQSADSIAVKDSSAELTYSKLDGLSDAVGSRLASLGVSLGDRVGVSFGRSIEFVVTMLGVLKAGGSYVPLDPDYPQERLDYLIADAGIQVVIASDEVADDWPVDAGSLFELLSWSELQEMAQTPSWEPVARSLLSETYQMYTSGSTGRPKGVCVADSGVLRLVDSQNYIEIDSSDVLLLQSSVAFDASTFEIWGALLNGAQLVVAPATTPSVSSIREVVSTHGVTVMWLTAALFHIVVEQDTDALRGVRVLLAGGDALSVAQVKKYLAAAKAWNGVLVNGYGPTEATTFSCCHVLEAWNEAWSSVPIGYPLRFSSAYVLDQQLNRVPVGVPGELYVGGSGLAHGYWGRPGLTASHFIPNPYRDGGDRLYKTGDRVRYLEDGRIEFLGRVDHQVKVRGHRIEPGEIEDAIRGLSGVQDAAVTVVEESGNKRLVAYVAGSVSVDEVSIYVKERLPSYLVPHHYELLESIPLTLNGKVDTERLPEPNWDGTGAYVAPQTEAERTLCEIWSEVLGVESVGVTDNFFELGGDSILSIQIAARAEQAGYAFSLEDLFDSQTVGELCARLSTGDTRRLDVVETSAFSLVDDAVRAQLPDGVEDAYPVGFTQLGMLYHSDKGREVSMYHDIIPHTFYLPLDEDALRASLACLIARHSVLRTAFFLSRYGESLQLVYSEGRPELSVVDSLAEWVSDEKARGFDWEQPGLVRFAARDYGDRFELVISIHHAIIDGWSISSFASELITDYSGRLAGKAVALPVLESSYRDYIALEQSALKDPQVHDYWVDQLSGFSPTEILSTGSEPGMGIRREALEFDGAGTEALKAIATDLGVSLKSVLLAVHVRAVGLLAGETDVVTGVVTNGRPETLDGEKLMGLFLNSVPLRQACGGGSWRELVESLATQEQAYWPHRRYPMPQLQRELNAESLFKHLFNYTHFRVYGEGNNADHMLRGVEDVAQAEAVGFEHSSYPLTIQAGQYGDGSGVYFALEADLNHYSHADFDRMMSVYQALMSSLIADVDSRYEQVDVLADQVSRYLPWEGTDAGYDLDQDLVSRFGAMVEAHGDRVALTDGSRHLTYAQLWSESNAAGSRIASLGVSLGDRVGVSFGRSIEFVVTMLGVLKAGGSYVPLDPDYPQERLDYLIADAGIQVVIASDEVADDWPVDAGSLFELLSWSELQEMAQTPSWEPVARSLLSETYQMYTSGSTGLPKGVCAHDQGVLRVTRAQNYIEILPEDVVLQLSSVAFDGSTFDIWGALLHGSCLALAQPGKPSIQSLTDDIDRYGVSVVFMTTALFHVMVKESIEAFRGLRVLLAGGEKMSITQLQQYLAFCSKWGGTFVHCYGPTEATTYSHCDVMHSWDDAWLTAPIGYPISHSTGYVLDQHLNRVPVGVPGELYVGGSGLAHGYWGRPGLTASHFIPNPYRDGGDRLYKTGDRVRYLEDGRIEFLGRVDHQVKIRGHRIEPGEIEDAIRGLSGVQDAAVTVIEASDSRRLVAYVAGSVSIDEVGSHLKERLPSYMVPYHYESVESIPLTLNGKIDYGRLPAPNWDGTGAYVAPQTEAEHTLCEIWSEVLGVESVGVTDNFFELGGDSILSIQIAARAEQAGYAFSLEDLFDSQTVGELCARLSTGDTRRLDAVETSAFSLVDDAVRAQLPDGVEDAYPVGFTQLGMLYHSDKGREVSMYHDIIPHTFYLPLDEDALRASLACLIARHSVLRTAFFLSRYGESLQLVYSEGRPELSVVDSLAEWVSDEKARGFDWEQPGLVRFAARDYGDRFELVISIHHAIIDGWSISSFASELITDYSGRLAGKAVALPVLESSYRDYIALEQSALKDPQVHDYWVDQLSGFNPTEILSTGSEPGMGIRREALEFDGAGTEALKAIATDLGVSLKSVLLAVHVRAVGLLAGETDVVTGVVTNGRPETLDGEKLVGLFLNSVPLRQACGGGSWRELVESLATQEQAYWPHRRYPMPQLQRELNAESLFKHLFNYTHFRVYGEGNNADHMLRGVEDVAQAEAVGFEHSNYPLTIQAGQYGDGSDVYFALEADLNHYSHADFDRMMSVYQALMSSLIADVDSRYEQVDVLADQVSRYLPWEGTDAGYDLDQDLVSRFGAMVEAHGDRVALTDGSRHLTYAQLWSESNAAGSRIASLGVSLGDRVGVSFGRSIEFVVTMLGVLKAGGSYVPLDPDYPQERLDYLIADAGIQVVIASDEVADDWPVDAGSLFELLSWSELQEMAQTPSWEPVARSLLSETYQMYTSGSTGLPKGVCAHDQGVLRVTRAQNYIEILPEDVVLQLSSVAFDGSTFDIWGALLHGSCLALAQPGKPSIQSLTDDIDRYGVSVVFMTTALFHVMVKESIEAFRGLRVLLAGGEKMSITQLQQYLAFCSKWGGTFVHCYGPTEATTYSHCDVMHSWDDAWLTAPIGYPISHSTGYVLDQHLNRVPVGVPGELYVGGSGLAHGYWGRPGLTASHFIPNPYRDGGDRLYKTGDRVRYLEDGRIEFLGRVDHQVKIRGHRIEPGEIEDAIRGLSGVQDAAVTVIEASDSRRLVAYVAGSVSIDEVGSHLKERLPSYMVPYHYESVESIPLTLNGKIDYGRLPAPNWDGTGAYVAPQTEAEHTLCEIWSEVLGVESVGVTDNFFELGGDSILSIQIAARAEQAGYAFSLEDLFDSQTVGELCARLSTGDTRRLDAVETSAFSLVDDAVRAQLPDGVEDAYPVGFTQLGMLYHSDKGREVSMYHDIIPHTFYLPLDEDALRASLACLIARHSVLRTAFFLSRYGESLQLVYSEGRPELSVVDSLAEWVSDEKARGFDWEQPGLVRFAARDYGDRFELVISIHHAIIDGWSISSFASELITDYSGRLAGKAVALPVLESSYRDYIALEQSALKDPQVHDYWVDQLSGFNPTEILSTGSEPGMGIRREALEFDGAGTEALKAIATDLGVSLKSVLLAVHVRAVGLLAGETDVVTGVVTNGRPETLDGEKLVGLFLNSVPLRQACGGGSWRELVESLATQEQAYWPHRRYPMPQLQRELNAESLFKHLFNYTHFRVYGEGNNADHMLRGVEDVAQAEAVGFEHSNYPLTIQAGQYGDGSDVYFALEADLNHYSHADFDRMMSVYQALMSSLIADVDSRYEQVDVLADQVSRYLPWEGTDAGYDLDQDLVSRFGAMVEAHGDRVALTDGSRHLTYAQLWSESNAAGSRIASLGVSLGDRVGVSFGRSIEFVVTMLGVLKAGGSYVPLDPDYPQERLDYLIADAGIQVVIASDEVADDWPVDAGSLFELLSWSELQEMAQTPSWEPVARSLLSETYQMYTSGSTGRPKGVCVADSGVLRLVDSQNYIEIDSSDVLLLQSSVAFDASTFEIWGALLNGAQLVVAPATTPSVSSIREVVSTHGVTVMWLTAALFHIVVEQDTDALRGVRVLLAGGDALSVAQVKKYLAAAKAWNGVLVNGYGPTEATTFSCCHVLEAWNEAWSSVPIGYPLRFSSAYVLDQQLNRVPVGVPGELYVGGSGLAHGYWGRPGLTASHFIPNPYRDGGDRLYKTGDRVRYLEDGRIEFLGRVDHQVKVRGHRIEPGEIEDAIRGLSGVQDAAVTVVEESGNKRLVAYVAGSVSVDEVSIYVKERLPSYLVPHHYELLESIPLTLNGKVDTERLPEPNWDGTGAYVAPQTEAERTLCEIWSEVLGVESVGVTDNFFELGGDSILSIQIAARAEQAGYAFSLEDLFDSQTVGELCARLSTGDTRRLDVVETSAFSLVDDAVRAQLPDGVVDAYPVSGLQQSMLYHQSQDSSVYNDIVHYWVSGEVDVDALKGAGRHVFSQHEIFRLSFDLDSYELPLQVLSADVEWPVEVLCYEGALSQAERDKKIQDWQTGAVSSGFDLSKAPVARLVFHVFSDSLFVVSFQFHHAILDGWSESLLMAQIMQTYTELLSGHAPSLRSPNLSYRDFVALERRTIEAEESQRFWVNQLAEPLKAKLPEASGPVESAYPDMKAVCIDRSLSDELQAFAQREGVALKFVLLGAHMKALSVLLQIEDVVSGVVLNGRLERAGGEEQIGMFLNSLPFRLDVSGHSWGSLVNACMDQERLLYPHRRMPLSNLQDLLQRRDLFEVAFNYVHFSQAWSEDQEQALGLLKREGSAISSLSFLTTFMLNPESSQVEGFFQFPGGVGWESNAEALVNLYKEILTSMVSTASKAEIGQLSLVSTRESTRITNWEGGDDEEF